MGFAPSTNGDMQPDLIARSNVPGFEAIGSQNLGSCSGGHSCPWHGTGVVNASMGVPDNGIGAAGPAGPVARPVLVYTLYDFFTGISATTIAAAEGAKVINMSYGVPVPASVSWTVLPFETTTAALRASGILLFAAAGNDSKDVDHQDCFVVCWEGDLFTPCENAGVICVGATDNGVVPACYSNWGAGGGVDIWAPGTVLVGSDPAAAGGAQAVNGTSVASPFTEGVAALAWAAVPGASASDVERALISNTRPGGLKTTDCDGEPVDGHVAGRFIDAGATIRDLLPRDVEIRSPADGSSFHRGLPAVQFEAFVYDDGMGAPTLRWTADGAQIGTGASFSKSDLAVGPHDIVVAATFPDGHVETDESRITIVNDAPSVQITSPEGGASFYKAQTVTFRGQSTDLNEPGLHLADSQVSWFLDGSPTSFATGHETSRTMSDLSVGSHTIAFRGSDGVSTAEASIAINVLEDPLNKPPTVKITSPKANEKILVTSSDGGGAYVNVPFKTTASDPESDPLTYEWYDRINNGTQTPLSTTVASPTLKLYAILPSSCSYSQHDVTVKVSDGTTTVSDTIRVLIDPGPC